MKWSNKLQLCKEYNNSPDTGDEIFRFWVSIPCLLMRWLLKSPVHQQAWCWLCTVDNLYCCVFSQLQDTIQSVNISFIVFKTIQYINTLRPRLSGSHLADDILICIFLNATNWISINISLKCVPTVRIHNIPALVRLWLGADQATSHYLNQWWLVCWRIYATLGLNESRIKYKTVVRQHIWLTLERAPEWTTAFLVSRS